MGSESEKDGRPGITETYLELIGASENVMAAEGNDEVLAKEASAAREALAYWAKSVVKRAAGVRLTAAESVRAVAEAGLLEKAEADVALAAMEENGSVDDLLASLSSAAAAERIFAAAFEKPDDSKRP